MAVTMGSAAQVWCVASLQSSVNGAVSLAPAASVCVRVGAGQRSVKARGASVRSVGVVRGGLGGSRGASVLERPKLDQSGSDNTPQTEEGMNSNESQHNRC